MSRLILAIIFRGLNYLVFSIYQTLLNSNNWFQKIFMGPQGFLGSGENGYLFSGSWGGLVIILGELGSKLIILGI